MAKIAFSAVAFVILASLIFVLWQRQPKQPQVESVNTSQKAQEEKIEPEELSINPKSGSVVSQATLKLEGKTQPDNFILVYSNSFQHGAKADSSGSFTAEISLEDGLNLFKVVSLTPSLEKLSEKNLDYYFSQDETGTVAAGPVKSIFDSLITVTTSSGEKHVRTSSSTSFTVPEEKGVEEAIREVDNIRIGDYAIAIGDQSDENSIIAKSFTVIRQNKPQLTEQTSIGTVASTLRQNIFSLKDKSGEIIEFSLSSTTSVLAGGKEAESDEIAKDKNAIIFYSKEENENLVDLIYLLP